MSDVEKHAFIGDLQIPWHDQRALTLWMKIMKWWKPTAITAVGDIDDQLEYSSFSDGTTDEFFNRLKKDETLNPMPVIVENAAQAKKFYTDLRKQHKEADIHACLGNHDIRIFGYIDKKAPEWVGEVTPNSLWGLDDLGITWTHYDDKPFVRLADIYVHHGATISSSGLAVKNDIENYGISLIRGHDHRGGVVYKSYPIVGKQLVGMGTGHMCSPELYGLRYTINPSWELGFGIAHVYNGKAQLEFVPITSDYECVVDGRLFKG